MTQGDRAILRAHVAGLKLGPGASTPQPLLDLLAAGANSGDLVMTFMRLHPPCVRQPDRYDACVIDNVPFVWMRGHTPPREVQKVLAVLQRTKSKPLGAHYPESPNSHVKGGGGGQSNAPGSSNRNGRGAHTGRRGSLIRGAGTSQASDDIDETSPADTRPVPHRAPVLDAENRVVAGEWWAPLDAPELADALERWQEYWGHKISDGYNLVRVRRARGRWVLVGANPFGHVEDRDAFLAPKPRPWVMGQRQGEVLDDIERVGELAARTRREYKVLCALERRGLLVSRIVIETGWQPTRRRVFRKVEAAGSAADQQEGLK